MRYFGLVASCAALAIGVSACAPKQPKRDVTAFDRTIQEDCYTVDLFTPAVIETPKSNVPQPWQQFAGHWGGGAWDGEWCHDLYILSVGAGGEVDLIEAHAPHAGWGKVATAFRRKATLTADSRLRLFYKGVRVEYWVENGRLYGARFEAGTERRVTLSRRSKVGA
ncbi:MAG: hypothetical protein ACPGSI_13625 [Pikeienuella sp.]